MTSSRTTSLTIAAVGLLMAGLAHADNLPSPCAPGEVGAGINCLYLVTAGNQYDAATGNRDVTTAALTLDIEVWMDFGATSVQGGAFDIAYDGGSVGTASWSWAPGFDGFATLDGAAGPNGWEGIQFDDFGGDGFGGETGSRPAFNHVGTLSIMLNGPASLVFGLVQPYGTATFPNCFLHLDYFFAGECIPTNFYSLSINADSGADADADGVPDSEDNCTQTANADQRDTDADGFGNLCDGDFTNDCNTNFPDLQVISSTFFSADADTDLNGDGIVNFVDLARMKQLFFAPPGPSALGSCP